MDVWMERWIYIRVFLHLKATCTLKKLSTDDECQAKLVNIVGSFTLAQYIWVTAPDFGFAGGRDVVPENIWFKFFLNKSKNGVYNYAWLLNTTITLYLLKVFKRPINGTGFTQGIMVTHPPPPHLAHCAVSAQVNCQCNLYSVRSAVTRISHRILTI